MSGDPLPNWGWTYGRAVNDPTLRPDAALRRLGFDAFSGQTTLASGGITYWTGRLTYVTAPWWALVTALGVGPSFRAIGLARARRARMREARGLCARCGYDLRATPEHCPECGSAASVYR
jgi:hypothetical protein